MAYLGSIPAANYKVIRKQTITGNGGTSYTLDYPVGNDQEIMFMVIIQHQQNSKNNFV